MSEFTADKEIVSYLQLSKNCKHSKQFKPTVEQQKQECQPLTAIYITNAGLEELGQPEKVKVVIEAAK